MKKEIDLAAKIVGWLNEQHWDVYQEVQFGYGGCVADIVAVRNKILWIIETKTRYGFDVLEQATRWAVHYRSIGIPSSRNNRDYGVAKWYYRVGVIEVSDYGIEEIIKPPLFAKNHNVATRYLSQLTELHKTFALAGSRNGHLTPYRQTMIDVQKFIMGHSGCTVKDIFTGLGRMHYSSATSFKGNLIKALMDFEKDWCRVDTTTKPYRLFCRQTDDQVNP